MVEVDDLPLVSVIMPYFDHAEYLRDAVASVVNLNYLNVELIVVDDCSPVLPARDVLADCTFENLRFVRHSKNRGHIASKNTGIENSQGEFILPLDSDDMVLPNFLQATVPLFQDKEIGVVLTDVEMIGDQNSVYTPALTKQQFVNLMTPSNTFLARRSLFNRLGPYDETLQYGDESDFLLRVLENNWKIGHVALPLYRYRKHEKGLSLSVSYVKLLADLIDRHPQSFAEHMKEALLYREQRYWGEIESCTNLGGTSSLGSAEVTVRQYQHLHTEFHKLLRHYEEIQSELSIVKNQLECLRSGKIFRLRDKLFRLLGAIKQ